MHTRERAAPPRTPNQVDDKIRGPSCRALGGCGLATETYCLRTSPSSPNVWRNAFSAAAMSCALLVSLSTKSETPTRTTVRADRDLGGLPRNLDLTILAFSVQLHTVDNDDVTNRDHNAISPFAYGPNNTTVSIWPKQLSLKSSRPARQKEWKSHGRARE